MFRAILFFLMLTGAARAEGIVVDLPIVGALVGAVVQDRPVTVLAEGQSDPHGLSLRPSQARALAEADLIVHLGSGLSPALERAIAEAGVPTVNLADVVGAAHAHTEDAEEADHGHGDEDPHLWLDADHVAPWIGAIGRALGHSAPHDAGTYSAQVERALDSVRSGLSDPPRLLLAHDSWSRLLAHLELPRYPAISDSHASAPGAQHLSALRDRIAAGEVDCILAAPGDPMSQAEALSADFDLPVVTADPQGDPTLDGLARYVSIFTGFADALADCQAKAM
ncbi:zinc ABC transporter substrate-binding protein [Maribius pontilimi]|uniref:Zinc ABC transporter substrate-binding protein n=1 Tax=Palleronia pontilimi TaxID=1964209 RepID=A0A934IAH2_9RHOB|nr:metal ABC transporter substrate-binding protein [Palleronia pontilimi]MBJ3763494.1 zinc ABC transporter substrate-binding protein [Palleronia pontilimi]